VAFDGQKALKGGCVLLFLLNDVGFDDKKARGTRQVQLLSHSDPAANHPVSSSIAANHSREDSPVENNLPPDEARRYGVDRVSCLDKPVSPAWHMYVIQVEPYMTGSNCGQRVPLLGPCFSLPRSSSDLLSLACHAGAIWLECVPERLGYIPVATKRLDPWNCTKGLR
jgi:hypothetical protein